MRKNLKFLFALLSLPLLLFSFSNCGGANTANNMKEFVQNPPFKIAEAYYQKWVAGVEDGGSGVNIHINFSEMDPNVVIQNIYFKNQVLEAKGNVNDPMQFVGYLKNEAKSGVIMDSNPMKEAQNTPSKKSQFELQDNEAVVEYLFAGKKNFYKISSISEKNMIPYPQFNPNSHE